MPATVDRTAAAALSLALVAVLALAACNSPPPEEPDEEEARALGRDTDETVFDDLIQTQDKARAVEGVTLGRKDELDRALEASEDDAAEEE